MQLSEEDCEDENDGDVDGPEDGVKSAEDENLVDNHPKQSLNNKWHLISKPSAFS